MTVDAKIEHEVATKTAKPKSDTVADMTRDELKALIREVMQEFIWELEQYLPDPDEGLELKPEVAAELLKARDEKGPRHSLEDVMNELGLNE